MQSQVKFYLNSCLIHASTSNIMLGKGTGGLEVEINGDV